MKRIVLFTLISFFLISCGGTPSSAASSEPSLSEPSSSEPSSSEPSSSRSSATSEYSRFAYGYIDSVVPVADACAGAEYLAAHPDKKPKYSAVTSEGVTTISAPIPESLVGVSDMEYKIYFSEGNFLYGEVVKYYPSDIVIVIPTRYYFHFNFTYQLPLNNYKDYEYFFIGYPVFSYMRYSGNLPNKEEVFYIVENIVYEDICKPLREALLTLGLCKHNDSYVKVWSAESATSESK